MEYYVTPFRPEFQPVRVREPVSQAAVLSAWVWIGILALFAGVILLTWKSIGFGKTTFPVYVGEASAFMLALMVILSIRKRYMFRTWVTDTLVLKQIELREILVQRETGIIQIGMKTVWVVRCECVDDTVPSCVILPDDRARYFITESSARDAIKGVVVGESLKVLRHPKNKLRVAIAWRGSHNTGPK